MWVSSLFLIGRPRPGAEAGLADFINFDFVPTMRRLCGATAVLTFWSREQAGDLPPVWCQIAARFQTYGDLPAFLDDPGQAPLRYRLSRALRDFDGSLTSIGGDVGPPRHATAPDPLPS